MKKGVGGVMEGVCWLPLKMAARYKPHLKPLVTDRQKLEKKVQQEGSEHVARFLYGLYNLYNVLSGLYCCIFTAACNYANWIKDSTHTPPHATGTS